MKFKFIVALFFALALLFPKSSVMALSAPILIVNDTLKQCASYTSRPYYSIPEGWRILSSKEYNAEISLSSECSFDCAYEKFCKSMKYTYNKKIEIKRNEFTYWTASIAYYGFLAILLILCWFFGLSKIIKMHGGIAKKIFIILALLILTLLIYFFVLLPSRWIS